MQHTFENSDLASVKNTLHCGGVCLFVDDSLEPARAYLVAPAMGISERVVSDLVRLGKGVLCAALPESEALRLALGRMVETNPNSTYDFTLSVEARSGVSTGISAADRAHTLDTLARTEDSKRDLVSPGHIFPVLSSDGGVLFRAGVSEAVCDLLVIAGRGRVGAFIAVLNDAGDLPDREQIEHLRQLHSLPLVTLSELIRFRMRSEELVELVASSELPIRDVGVFRAHCYRSLFDRAEHLVLTLGNPGNGKPSLVRVQTEDRLGDLFSGGEFYTHARNIRALQRIAAEGEGIFLYIRHPRRGLLTRAVRGINQTGSSANAAMSLREYGIGTQLLRAFGAHRVRLLTNSNVVSPLLEAFDVTIEERVGF